MRRRIVAGLVAVTSLACAPTALAATDPYWSGQVYGGERRASSSHDNFRKSEVIGPAPYYYVDAAAHYPGGWDLYGSWVRGTGYACHAYAGTMNLGALLRNPHTITLTMVGNAYYSTSAVC